MRKKHTKSKLVTIAILLLLLSIAGTGTLAYFTDSTTAHNEITTGKIDIELIEIDKNGIEKPFEKNYVTGVMPGTSVSKMVGIENCAEPSWIRVMVNISGQFADGTAMRGTQLHPIKLEFNRTDWIYCEDDNYWYYNKIIDKNVKTAPLFSVVKFDKTMPNAYQNCTIYIDVKAEAIQAKNNPKGWSDSPIIADTKKV